MNVNDRIALALGQANLSRIVAETQRDDANERLAAQATRIAELEAALVAAGGTVEGTGGSGTGSDPGGASDAATV